MHPCGSRTLPKCAARYNRKVRPPAGRTASGEGNNCHRARVLCYDKETPLIAPIPDILSRIAARKREELAQTVVLRAELERRAGENISTRRDFRAALDARSPAFITEIKRASPSRGVLAAGVDPVLVARQYEEGGAAALSVLTDRDFFQGSLDDLSAARQAVSIPVLRKDFTIDEYHVVEAAAHGADAILLIVALLTEEQIRHYTEFAAEFGMDALVEVHDAAELDVAVGAGAGVIGVNNRDLAYL